MDVTIVGLSSAGKTSLVRVLAVYARTGYISNKTNKEQGGEFTIKCA